MYQIRFVIRGKKYTDTETTVYEKLTLKLCGHHNVNVIEDRCFHNIKLLQIYQKKAICDGNFSYMNVGEMLVTFYIYFVFANVKPVS